MEVGASIRKLVPNLKNFWDNFGVKAVEIAERKFIRIA